MLHREARDSMNEAPLQSDLRSVASVSRYRALKHADTYRSTRAP